MTLTLKKGLLGSKLAVLSDLRQAEAGMKLHGVVTGIQKYGVFVGEQQGAGAPRCVSCVYVCMCVCVGGGGTPQAA